MNHHDDDITLDRLADLLDGKLPDDEAARLRRAIEASDALRADYDWLRTTADDLEAVAVRIEGNVPEIDVFEEVMHAIGRAGANENTVRFDARKAKSRPTVAFWSATALAAAVVLVLAGVAFQSGIVAPDSPRMPQISRGYDIPKQQDAPLLDTDPQATPETERTDRLVAAMQQLVSGIDERLDSPAKRTDRSAFRPTAAPNIGNVTQDEIIALRQAAITDPAAWPRLKQLASLDAATAAEIAANPDVAPAAIVGAAASLPAEEARQWLVTAVGRMDQQQPYARLALAKTHLAPPPVEPGTAEDILPPALLDGMNADDLRAFLNEIAALQALDPHNALFDALRAGALLRLGDTAGALAALQELQSKTFANAYGLDAAQSRQQALLAAGMPQDAARALSAVLAGSGEYNMLCDLARDLLQSGQAHEAQGDLETARQIYEATERLGEQIAASASLSEEALAGIDIQRMALEELEALYAGSGLAADMERLTASALALVSQIDTLGEILDSLNRLFLGGGDDSFWTQLSEQVLQMGDLSLFQGT